MGQIRTRGSTEQDWLNKCISQNIKQTKQKKSDVINNFRPATLIINGSVHVHVGIETV